ncbi:MAG: efflux RND transporter permease subunit [Solibacillus sp.]
MIEYLIKKRKITITAFIVLCVFGVISFLGLPKQEIPDLVISQAMVTTVYPGATPETMEQNVTNELEQKINELDGVKTITSTSSEGFSSIMVALEGGVEPEKAWAELRTKVQDAQGSLPKDAMQPVVNDDLISTFISSYAVRADSQEDLNKLNDLMDTWKDQIRKVNGVSEVTFTGLPEREIRVDIDTKKLQQYNLNWSQISNAITAETSRVPIGDVDFGERNYQLRMQDARSIEQLGKIVVSRTQEGFPIYLEQVATVALTHEESEIYSYVDGQPAITFTVNAKTGSDVPSIHEGVVATMDKLEKTLPEGYSVELLYAQNDTINYMFKNLSKELMIAMVAVIIVCMMGLNLITSSLVMLAIPISLAVGLLFLPTFGVTLNQMTIIGVIIVLSLLVDDAIVVNENIERRLSVLKESPLQAAVNGTKEVLISIVTATLATISAFLPLMFLPGDMGKFILPIPLVIIVSLLASMAMSLTIVPIFRHWNETKRLKKHKEGFVEKPAGFLGKQIETVKHVYSEKLMRKVVQNPFKVALAGMLIGTAGYFLVPFVKVELFPSAEEAEFTIDIEYPTGTALVKSNELVQEVATWVQGQENIEKVSYSAGGAAPTLFSSMGAGSGGNVAQISVVGTKGSMDIPGTIASWNTYFEETYPGISIVTSSMSAGISMGSPISIRLTGTDNDQLKIVGEEVKRIIAEANGTMNIGDSAGIARYSLEFEVNQNAMDQNLVSYTTLTSTLRLMSQGIGVTTFDTGDDLIDVTMYLDELEGDPTTVFQRLSIPNATGQQIPLAQIAELKPTFSVQSIAHYNLQRSLTITSDLVEGVTATEAMAQILPKLEALSLPDGYAWSVGGETEQMNESFTDLAMLFMACIIMIIILITLQFYSFSIPVIILATVYLAASGGIIGMFVTGTAIGFMSVIGITALAGIVVRNGIVLIEFIVDKRKEGVELREAVVEATEARFRPILLTAMAAILGLLPVAIIGDILFRPMAITIVSGVIFSTVLTLFVVPSLYIVVTEWKEKRTAKKLAKEEARYGK